MGVKHIETCIDSEIYKLKHLKTSENALVCGNQNKNLYKVVARLLRRTLWVWPCYRNFMLVIWCYRRILSDTFTWPNEQQSRLPLRRSVIVSQEGRLFKFGIVKPLSKSYEGRCKRPNFVFWVAGSVLFVSRWVVMAWSNVWYRASWNFA